MDLVTTFHQRLSFFRYRSLTDVDALKQQHLIGQLSRDVVNG